MCAQSSTMMHFCGLLGPLPRGTFATNDDNRRHRGQLWISTLSPHLLSPHVDFPDSWRASTSQALQARNPALNSIAEVSCAMQGLKIKVNWFATHVLKRSLAIRISANLSGHHSLFSVHKRMVHWFPLHSRIIFPEQKGSFCVLSSTWQSRANASLMHSIHANTFTPFTRILATKVQTYLLKPRWEENRKFRRHSLLAFASQASASLAIQVRFHWCVASFKM